MLDSEIFKTLDALNKNNFMNLVIGILLVVVIVGLVLMKLGKKLKIVLSENTVKLQVIGIYLFGRKWKNETFKIR